MYEISSSRFILRIPVLLVIRNILLLFWNPQLTIRKLVSPLSVCTFPLVTAQLKYKPLINDDTNSSIKLFQMNKPQSISSKKTAEVNHAKDFKCLNHERKFNLMRSLEAIFKRGFLNFQSQG